MTERVKLLIEEARKLTDEERAELLERLWDLVPEHPDPEVPDWHLAAPAERLAEHEANPDGVIPWEQVKANLFVRKRS